MTPNSCHKTKQLSESLVDSAKYDNCQTGYPGYLFILMDTYGYSSDICGYSSDICGYLWIFMDIYGYLWIFMGSLYRKMPRWVASNSASQPQESKQSMHRPTILSTTMNSNSLYNTYFHIRNMYVYIYIHTH